MSDAEDFGVIRTVFFYSVLILLLPIASFFTTKVLFFDGKNHMTFYHSTLFL